MKMKFVVIVTPGDVPMPPGMIADLLAAQKDWLNARIADGTVEVGYAIVGGGGIGVVNVDSHEEMHELLVSSPGFAIANYEVRPLADLDTTMDASIAALRQAASMMPGPPG
jgi:muconolactone delta-isomerase